MKSSHTFKCQKVTKSQCKKLSSLFLQPHDKRKLKPPLFAFFFIPPETNFKANKKKKSFFCSLYFLPSLCPPKSPLHSFLFTFFCLFLRPRKTNPFHGFNEAFYSQSLACFMLHGSGMGWQLVYRAWERTMQEQA